MNCLYLRINHASGYIEQVNGNKYLIFDSKDGNKELLKKYSDVFDEIRGKIKEIGNGEYDYEKITRKLNLILMMTYH